MKIDDIRTSFTCKEQEGHSWNQEATDTTNPPEYHFRCENCGIRISFVPDNVQ